MSDLKVTGEIVKILEVESGTSKGGKAWIKQNFVLNTGEKFNPEVCFQIFGQEKCDNFAKYNKVGEKVDVSFNISSREFNGKYYHNLDAWKVFKAEMETGTPKEAEVAIEAADDLPF
tara:strand:- start:3192 stop:3542 length:351 start_codon:yes stop_codon:yes gene_type:complete